MTTRTLTITERLDPHNGWGDDELVAEAREWALDHGLIDVTVVIAHDLRPTKAVA